MTYVYKDIDGLKTLRIWVGKYIKHILNKGAKYTKKSCKNGAKRSEILGSTFYTWIFSKS